MEDTYLCKKCGWQGSAAELEYDETETCFGTDKIEMCPQCGSYEVILVRQPQ